MDDIAVTWLTLVARVPTGDMPLGYLTQMTDQEREILAGRLAAGAPAR